MKIIYRSFDNKDFDIKEECELHEDNLITLISNVIYINTLGREIREYLNTNTYEKFKDNMSYNEYIEDLNTRVKKVIVKKIFDRKDTLIEVLNEYK